MLAVLRMGHRRLRSLAGGAQPHPGHQPPDTLAPDAAALLSQMPRHLAAAVERRLQELGIPSRRLLRNPLPGSGSASSAPGSAASRSCPARTRPTGSCRSARIAGRPTARGAVDRSFPASGPHSPAVRGLSRTDGFRPLTSPENRVPPPAGRSWRGASRTRPPSRRPSPRPCPETPRPSPRSPGFGSRPRTGGGRTLAPGVDHRLMHAMLRHQLGGRHLAPDRLEGHLRIELGAVVLPFASQAVSPRTRWRQAWQGVRISGTTSDSAIENPACPPELPPAGAPGGDASAGRRPLRDARGRPREDRPSRPDVSAPC